MSITNAAQTSTKAVFPVSISGLSFGWSRLWGPGLTDADGASVGVVVPTGTMVTGPGVDVLSLREHRVTAIWNWPTDGSGSYRCGRSPVVAGKAVQGGGVGHGDGQV